MVVLAIAAAGVLLPFANATAVQTEAARQVTAATLASELVERIRATEYATIIAAYDGYSEAAGALQDGAGVLHSGSAYANFSRSAACVPATVGAVDLIAVTVTVSYSGSEMMTVTTLIGNHE